jgi:hypothetical protein
MKPGAICAQMVRCGRSNCKCARGELHGPYYYHFTRIAGVLNKRYVKAADVSRLREVYDTRRAIERQDRAAAQSNHRHWSILKEGLQESERLITEWRSIQHA